MSEETQFSRRELLRNVGTSVALATYGVGLVTPAAAQHVHNALAQQKAAVPKAPYPAKSFTAHEFQTLQRLADLIIPADEHSPGALEAGAAEFIDYLSSNSPELTEIYSGGIGWLDHEMQRRYSSDFVGAR